MSDMSDAPLDGGGEAGADPGWRGKLAWAALIFSGLVLVWFAIAAFGSKFRVFDPLYAFGTLAVDYGSKLTFVALGFGVLALIVGFIRYPRTKPVILSLFALLIAGSILGRFMSFRGLAEYLPPIHDVQTDWNDPVSFSDAVLAAREADNARNAIEADPVIPDSEGVRARWPDYAGKRVAEVQEAAEIDPDREYENPADEPPYPDIAPLMAERPASEVYAIALDLVKSEGWTIISETPATATSAGVIEATAETGAFGFRDDVAIRIRPEDTGTTRVDMRSVSRVGLSDVGANALRVVRFLDNLERRTAGPLED